MARFYFETASGEAPPRGFGGADDVLVYFLSFAFATRYGSQHDLSKLALLLRGADFGIDLRPLLTFADRDVEEDADRAELERVWQDAAPLAATLGAVLAALDGGDPRVDALVAGTPGLRDRLADLLAMAEWAAARGERVRLTYEV